jgi:hypothetical protein
MKRLLIDLRANILFLNGSQTALIQIIYIHSIYI